MSAVARRGTRSTPLYSMRRAMLTQDLNHGNKRYNAPAPVPSRAKPGFGRGRQWPGSPFCENGRCRSTEFGHTRCDAHEPHLWAAERSRFRVVRTAFLGWKNRCTLPEGHIPQLSDGEQSAEDGRARRV